MQKVGQLTYEVTRQHVETLVGVDEGLISEALIDLYSKQELLPNQRELLVWHL